jgi:membrane protease YdiL (CAAX protease family)
MRFSLPESRMIAEAREQIRWKRTLPRPVELIIEVLIFLLLFAAVGVILPSSISAAALVIAPHLSASQNALVELFATAGTIIGIIVYCRVIEGRRIATLGFRRGHALREYLAGALIGLALFSLTVLLCVLMGTLDYRGFVLGSGGLLLLLLLGYLIQGLNEELLLRGYFMVTLARKQSLAVAIIVSSCFFAVLHLFNANVQVLALVNILLFGSFAAVYLLKRGNIWGAAAIHSAWNFSQGCIYGIPVSGIENPDSLFSFTPVVGGELISGGAFGVEGGLAATIVLVVALVVVLLMKSSDPAPQPPSTDEQSQSEA